MEGTNKDRSRPPLKVRRVSLDTGRENVVVISRHSSALRPDAFRGFSRVELRAGSRVLLATLLITDEDALVGPAVQFSRQVSTSFEVLSITRSLCFKSRSVSRRMKSS